MGTTINRVPLQSFPSKVVVEALGTSRNKVFRKGVSYWNTPLLGGNTLFKPPVDSSDNLPSYFCTYLNWTFPSNIIDSMGTTPRQAFTWE